MSTEAPGTRPIDAGSIPALDPQTQADIDQVVLCESKRRDGNNASHIARWSATCDCAPAFSLHCEWCAERIPRHTLLAGHWACAVCKARVDLVRIECI